MALALGHKDLKKLSLAVDGSEIPHQLRSVVYPTLYVGFYTSQVVGDGISEPSTVVSPPQAAILNPFRP